MADLSVQPNPVTPDTGYRVSWSSKSAKALYIDDTRYGISSTGQKAFTSPSSDGEVSIRLVRSGGVTIASTTLVVQSVAEPIPQVPEPPPPGPSGPVLDLYLIDATTDTRLRKLAASDQVDLGVNPSIAVEATNNANTPGAIGSVVFRLDGAALSTENSAPYAAWGNTGTDFAPWPSPSIATHTIEAQAWSAASGTGTLYGSFTCTLVVTDSTPPAPPPASDGGWPTRITSVMTAAALSFAKDGQGLTLQGRDIFDYDIAQGDWGKVGGTHEYPLWTYGGYRWRQTNPSFTDSSGRGKYKGQWTTWVTGGEMREWVRNGPESAPFTIQASPINRLVSRPLIVKPGNTPSLSDQSRWPVFRIDLLLQFPGDEGAGYKSAYLCWGSSTIGTVGYAEEDMPEHKWGSGLRSNAFHHNADAVGGQVSVALQIDTTGWHLYTIWYNAKGANGSTTGFVRFYTDGNLRLNATTNVSTGSLYYAKQSETYLSGQAIPTPTDTGPQGIVRTRMAQIWTP